MKSRQLLAVEPKDPDSSYHCSDPATNALAKVLELLPLMASLLMKRVSDVPLMEF